VHPLRERLTGRRCLTTRCISYLTIEHQGVIARELAARFAGWWFGCDLCQEVCPWNRFAPPAEDARLDGPGEDEAALIALRAEDFDAFFAGRAVRRLGWERFRRNLLVALWSVGRHAEARQVLAGGEALVRAQATELGLGG
jgi:epoxyqueuosine reductase